MEFRKFKSISNSPRGRWNKIQNPDSFHLRLSVDSHSYKTFVMLSSPAFYGRSSTAASKSVSYGVMVLTKSDQWTTIYQFQSYKLVLQLVKT